uniref:Uncharacterized protein n=1 Tax=Cacopsylla melanoneura TaxID=428564 RepID=A0A8D8SRH5_9HEMI
MSRLHFIIYHFFIYFDNLLLFINLNHFYFSGDLKKMFIFVLLFLCLQFYVICYKFPLVVILRKYIVVVKIVMLVNVIFIVLVIPCLPIMFNKDLFKTQRKKHHLISYQ